MCEFGKATQNQSFLHIASKPRAGDGALCIESVCVSLTYGPMGVKNITKHLNAAGIRTRDGGRWGLGAVHKKRRVHRGFYLTGAPIHHVTPFESTTPAFRCPYGLSSGSLSDVPPA